MKPASIIVAIIAWATLFALPVGAAPALADERRAQVSAEAAKRAEAAEAAKLSAPKRAMSKGWQRLDPVACADLCRLFEWLGSLERRTPDIAAPTS